MDSDSPPPSSHEIAPFRQSLLAVLGISFVVVMVAVDQTVVSTALPTIVADLHEFDLYAWVATSYFLMTVITIPIFGRLGDYYGRKPFVLGAIVIFTFASMLCGLANSMLLLVVARALQGVGGGMLMGTAVACISDLFPDARMRLRWQVMLAGAFGIASTIGPSLGGALTQYYGWRSVFFVNLPVGLVGLVLVIRYLPRIRHGERPPGQVDWPGAMLIALALGSLQFLVELMSIYGLTARMVALAVLCGASTVVLLWWEQRTPRPIVPVDLFRDLKVSSLFVLAVLVGFSEFTIIFYAPLMFQGGLGLSPKDAGLLITPLVLFNAIGVMLNSRIVTRVGSPNVMLYVGFALMAVSVAGIAMVGSADPRSMIVLLMATGGLGLGFIMPNLIVFAQESVDRARLGIVTAMLQCLRMTGAMLGTGLVGILVTHRYVAGIAEILTSAEALQWRHQLVDPQVLINREAQTRFLREMAQNGVNGLALLDAARNALVSAVHLGQVVGVMVLLFALWRVRAVPKITFEQPVRVPPPSH